MPNGLHQKRLAQLACVVLLLLLAPGCRISGNETDYGRYGLYRVLTIDRCEVKSPGDKKPHLEWMIGTGSAFLINDRNLVATNRHVVDGCPGQQAHWIFLASFKDDGKKDEGKLVRAEVKRIVSGDPKKPVKEDLAFLQPNKTLAGDPWPIAAYDPSTGSQVRALGFPAVMDEPMRTRIEKKASDTAQEAVKQQQVKSKEEAEELYITTWVEEYKEQMKTHRDEFRPSFTEGVVSRALAIDDVPVVQHQAPISPGNSGGPLLDLCGNVIGMNTLTAPGAGLAISLGGKWIADEISAAGFDVNQKKGRCLAARVDNQTNLIAIAAAILLASAIVFFAFKKSPWGQPGYKVLTPAEPGAGLDGAHIGANSPSPSAGTTNQAGAPGYIRLAPVSGGSPLILPAGRVSYIGRDPGSDGVIADSSVSRRHARINLDSAGQVVIEDAGSANGTWKGGAKISRETFASGELVRFGNVEYRIELPNDDAGGQRATELLPGARGELPLTLSGIADGQAVHFSLKPSPVERTWTIGRKAEDVDLVIPNLRISSIHARIRYRPGRGFEICDLGSSNGTKIDGRYLERDYISLEGVRKITLGDLDLNLNRGG